MVLSQDPTSDTSLAAVKGPIRTTAHDSAPDGTTALVGGTTSVFVDFQKAMNRDYAVVFPVAAIVIFLILALVLRSLVAPLYLMVSVGLGFGATLGAAVLLFQHIKGEDGLIFLLPIYIYLFVVALGTDYNILMITRLREESREGETPRNAAAEALKHAGPTVAAAGVILAGTFASLMLGGNALLVAMGFSISFGIFVSAFVMAMFFTPSLTALLGHAAWWPGHSDEKAPYRALGGRPRHRGRRRRREHDATPVPSPCSRAARCVSRCRPCRGGARSVIAGSPAPARCIISPMSGLAVEELLEGRLVRPLVDHEDLVVGAVEVVRDDAVLLGTGDDGLQHVRVGVASTALGSPETRKVMSTLICVLLRLGPRLLRAPRPAYSWRRAPVHGPDERGADRLSGGRS